MSASLRNPILVSGATSFLGAHISATLANAGYDVIGTFKTDGPRLALLMARAPTVRLIKVDLTNDIGLDKLNSDIDAIIHVAALSPAPNIATNALVNCNVLGTQNLVEFGVRRAVKKFIFMSSVSLYGRVTDRILDERTPILEPDTYGATKLLGERLLAGNSDKMPAIALRLPGILGRNAHRAWIPTLVQKARRNDDIFYYNPNNQFNNAILANDVADFCCQLVAENYVGFHAFPLAASNSIKVSTLVEMIVESTGSLSKVGVGSRDQSGFTISNSYASHKFGYIGRPIEEIVSRYCSDPGDSDF